MKQELTESTQEMCSNSEMFITLTRNHRRRIEDKETQNSPCRGGIGRPAGKQRQEGELGAMSTALDMRTA